jgi:CHAT domain-containing protein
MIAGRRAWLLGAALLALGAGVARAADSGPLGQDLAGEACKWGGPSSGGGATTGVRALPIQCGERNDVAGTLWAVPFGAKLPDEPAARRAAIIRTAKAAPGGLGAAEALRCDAGQKLAPDSDNLIFACTLQSNGWPRLVLLALQGNVLYEGEGMPALLPVLEAAVAGLSGHALAPAETETALRLVETKFPGAMAHAGGADAALDKSLVEQSRLAAAERNYAGAEAGYRRALAIETKVFGGGAIAVGETLAELALQVSNQGRFDEAAGLFRRAEPIVNGSPSISARARLASYLALDAANRRKFADALNYARQSTQMRRAELTTLFGPDAGGTTQPGTASRGELAHSLRIEASMALRLNELPSALAAAEEVLRIVSDEPGLPLWWRPEAVTMMAEINARDGRVVPAEREFREALAMQEKLFGDSAPTAFTAMQLGRFYADQHLWPSAVAAFRIALGTLAKDPVARATIVPDQIVPFLAAAAALAEREPPQRTALQSDMLRASQFLSSDVAGRTIARAAQRLAAEDPALASLMRDAQEAQRARDGARIQLAAETAKTDDQRNAARETKLQQDLSAATAHADEIAAKVQHNFPNYANFAEPGPVELGELQVQLRPGEAFLSFIIGNEDGYALLVTPDAMSVQRVGLNASELTADVGELRRAFTPRLGGVPDFDLKASFELYRKLLGPLEGRLQGIEHLIVAPSGALASLPMALLVTAAPRDTALKNYGDAAWLMRRFAISEVPSLRAFLSLRAASEHPSHAPKPFLGIGDPAFVGADRAGEGGKALDALAQGCREAGPIAPALLRALPPLKETAEEVRTVGKLLGADAGSLLLGTDATEANLRARPLDQYGVIYFATHGLLPGELHCQTQPGLVLSPPATAAKSTAEDGLLDASEIAGLKLDADLVVLSACNTAAASGQLGGAALSGLADAFFNAGARIVLASHWEVPSLATVKLMTDLFRSAGPQLKRGLAQSLRQAQLALVGQASTAHPFYWAAFTVMGDGAAQAQTATAPPAPGEGSKGRT